MLQKKVCMLGSFAVGKTSLVSRFVHSIYSEKYITTVGVKIDKKTVDVDGVELMMVLWDLHGEDEFQKVRMSYLRGLSGYLLVLDGTRRSTIEPATALHEEVVSNYGRIPSVTLLNKADLTDDWELEDRDMQTMVERGWTLLRTSAKTGENVERAFATLGRLMMDSTNG